ncbi:uncharacterized protein LOC135206470 [Macrobrachium nipponense]|uniref:uncharacterized protein LOC135206470 n=1 Tax=Macrobrachium nipponense TaxID=159736 RepID=UPI0030C8043D
MPRTNQTKKDKKSKGSTFSEAEDGDFCSWRGDSPGSSHAPQHWTDHVGFSSSSADNWASKLSCSTSPFPQGNDPMTMSPSREEDPFVTNKRLAEELKRRSSQTTYLFHEVLRREGEIDELQERLERRTYEAAENHSILQDHVSGTSELIGTLTNQGAAQWDPNMIRMLQGLKNRFQS